MASIQASPYPLAFAVAELPPTFRAPPCPEDPLALSLRTTARALEGMQKEAVVACGSSGSAWRLTCDEGPYLKGSDLAPFPLGFFCAGMVSCYMKELLRLLRERGISFRKLKLLQENRYSMAGSALAGTMTGSALPVALQLTVDSPLPASQLQALLQEAVASAPVAALLGGVCVNEFSLVLNGERLQTQRVESTINSVPPAPAGFDALLPHPAQATATDLIIKVASAGLHEGVSGGVASSLQDHQQRELRMQGTCILREDGLCETRVDLFQPIGSSFRFVSDESGSGRAPHGLVLLSAGIAFCFLTQAGRYTTIRKWPLQSCQLVQDTCFHPAREGHSPRMQPVVTHLYLQADLDEAQAQQVLDMSEQTCFLHAACRQPVSLALQQFCRAIPIVP
jgi:organic hydroperoxide reductase OsmC/OhrA